MFDAKNTLDTENGKLITNISVIKELEESKQKTEELEGQLTNQTTDVLSYHCLT